MLIQARTEKMPPRITAAGWHDAPTAPDAARLTSAGALAALEEIGTRQSARRGEEFYLAGDPAEFCYRIVSGSVRTVGVDADGRRQIADFLLPGDLFGFDSLGTHHLSAEAMADTVVVRFPRRAVEALAQQHGALAMHLRDITMRTLRRAHEKMFLLGRKSASERIALFLMEMAGRTSGKERGAIALPMTRADIADHLGLTIETVSRNMAQLCRDGTIATTRAGIQIRQWAALERFGAETRH
jgi:CRP-like cAMP-binding protein